MHEYLNNAPVMQPRDALHEMGGGMVAKVGAHVADTETTSAGRQVLWMLVWWLV